jgi:DNA-binding CsgD family transcriptional regulator
MQAKPVSLMSVGNLTKRELEVAARIIQGDTDPQIAVYLSISSRTVEAHVRKILAKTGCRTRTELAGQETMTAAIDIRTAPSPGTVRITVDLPAPLHRQLSDYVIKTGRTIGAVKLAQAEVIRAMILAADNDLVNGAIIAILRSTTNRLPGYRNAS